MRSGGHGIRSGRFSQGVAKLRLASKALERQSLRSLWLLLVVAGCIVLLSVVFSTVLAQSSTSDFGWHPSPLDASNSIVLAPLAFAANALARKRSDRLRILIYARYSTDEQDETSLPDQFGFCRLYLEQVGLEGDITEIGDAAISGEVLDRPGMNRIWPGLESRQWDLIVCEDSSRLFRMPTKCLELVETAVDRRIRVICINDDVDTNEEDWQAKLVAALQEHAGANRRTRQRIARKALALWRMGAAVAALRPGYRRVSKFAASLGEPARGPHFDELDEAWAPIVREAYDRIARGERPWAVAAWLCSVGLPRYPGSKRPWDARGVIALIRCEVYRGVELRSKNITVQLYRELKKVSVRNAPERVKSRDMEKLRIVPDWLWHKANDAINGRVAVPNPLQGEDHPLYQIPRDSRGPLSGLLVCGICGAKIYVDGGQGGAYRCSGVRKGACWNKATVPCPLTHSAISTAIGEKLLQFNGQLDALVQYALAIQHERPHQQAQEDILRAALAQAERKCKRFTDAIGLDDTDLSLLVASLQAAQRERVQAQANLDEFLAITSQACPSTPDEIRASIIACQTQLLDFSPAVSSLLRQILVGPIKMVPYGQFDSNKVVLRAEFTLRLSNLLPPQLLNLLNGGQHETALDIVEVECIVNLFEPSGPPKYALVAAALRDKMTVTAMAAKLGLSLPIARRASQLGAKMRAAGLTDPYIRLSEAPTAASRWGKRRLPPQATTDGQHVNDASVAGKGGAGAAA